MHEECYSSAPRVYRFPARRTQAIERQAGRVPLADQTLSWTGTEPARRRFRLLSKLGSLPAKTLNAVAREVCGFIWARWAKCNGLADFLLQV